MYKYKKEVTAPTFDKIYKGHTFAFMVKDELEKAGWKSERAFSKHVGNRSHAPINQLASGKAKSISLDHAIKLCVELGCTLDDLFPIVQVEGQDDDQEK